MVVEEDLCGLADDVAAGDWVVTGVCGIWYGDDGRGVTSAESE